MKNSNKSALIFAFIFSAFIAKAQSDSLGMPGDNLDLRAVLTIFKQSSNIEEFERKLNAADSKVNNLDLNNDQQVDYLRVVDHAKDNFHSIVIQTPVSKSETQDVAVIEVEKSGDQVAHIQIIGDETLYGRDYIIEPKTEAQAKAIKKESKSYDDDVYRSSSDKTSNDAVLLDSSDGTYDNSQVMVNVWGWPSVAYIYSPGYSLWVSPWYWGYYPTGYSPWSPYGWYHYHQGFIGWNYGYYGYRTNVYAFPRAHNYYYGRRASSGYVGKTAPNYGRRNYNGAYRSGQAHNRGEQRATSGNGSRINNSGSRNSNNGGRVRSGNEGMGGQRMNRSGNGGNSPRMNPGGNSGGGGTRISPGGSGGGRMNNGGNMGGSGGGRSSGGGGNMGGGGGRMSGGSGGRR